MPRHTVRDLSCNAVLYKQVALAIRRLVMLVRVVREMLPAFGEHHAIDLHFGIRPGHRDVLIHFGQPAAERADRPLQSPLAADIAF